jgi:hypothetical protein
LLFFRILKSIEFSNSSDESNESIQGKSLEMLLMEKNRALQTENTQVKVANNEISGKCTQFLSFRGFRVSPILSATLIMFLIIKQFVKKVMKPSSS